MIAIHLRIVILFLASACFLTCDDEIDFPDATGPIVGYVRLLDEDGQLMANHDQIRVELHGRISSATTTNDNGKFEFFNVPAGNYSVHFIRSGFEVVKWESLSHLGGSVTLMNYPQQSVFLAPASPNIIKSWTVETYVLNSGFVSFLDYYLKVTIWYEEGHFNDNTNVVLFMDDETGVSADQNLGAMAPEQWYLNEDGSLEGYFSLFGNRPEPGKAYYLRLYPYNGATPYRDVGTGNLIIPSLGEASTEQTITF